MSVRTVNKRADAQLTQGWGPASSSSGVRRYRRPVLSAVLAVVDVAVGAWLIRYAVGPERRDHDGVLATGGFLLVCAGPRVLVGLLLEPGQLIGETPPRRQM